jgi:drug/metabolite transporter (DMT)-like permease
MVWVVVTLIAAAAQTARNAMQSSLTSALGTLGATQTRFVFGLPFALVFVVLVTIVGDAAPPAPTAEFLAFTAGGALAQVLATALMLAAMRAGSFSVTTAFTKTEALQIVLFGWIALGERMTPIRVTAVAIATLGVWLAAIKPGEGLTRRSLGPALLGIAAGGLFALAAVGFRGGILALPEGGYWLRAATTLAWSLGIQAAALGAWLALFSREVLMRSFALWRQSFFAGFMGAFASQFWFLGFSLTAAANVRTLALVEVLFAYAVGRRAFGQRLSLRQALGMTLLVAGVALLVVVV